MKLKSSRSTTGLTLAAVAVGILLVGPALAAGEAAATQAAPVFARVGDVVITQREYDIAFAVESRNTFYHGKPPEEQIAKVRREVGDKLINNVLLLNEAKRRKLAPDAAEVKQKVEQYDQRNSGRAEWQQIRERALSAVTAQFETESLLQQLEQQVRKVSVKEKQVRAFYAANPDKFTEPEQVKVSLILLKVDPADTPETWEAAREFGRGLIKQVREGASFAELAKKYSGDTQTADKGGDMGYLHGGMMSGLPEETVRHLKPGEVSDVVTLMEGVGIFKLDERKEARLNSYEKVRQRARELCEIDQGERAWKALTAKLRAKTVIRVEDPRFSTAK